MPKRSGRKSRKFLSVQLANKPVTALAGIGKIMGGRLTEKGFGTAQLVLEEYLKLNHDDQLFIDWMKRFANANSRQASVVVKSLRDYCEIYVKTPIKEEPPSSA